MHAYIINLPDSKERKKTIEEMLLREDKISFEFIEAVDGRKLNNIEKEKLFNIKKAEKWTGWKILPGEIGCTLSHQKCYKQLLESKMEYVLILEDDILLKEQLSPYCSFFDKFMDTSKPTILLISGFFWYSTSKEIDTHIISVVKDASLTHSYLINRAAARLLIESRPFVRADDWKYLINKGVYVYGLRPHLVNQNNAGGTTISTGRNKLPLHLFARLREMSRSFNIHLYSLINHSEPRE